MKKISDKKLNAPFEKFDTLEIEYVQLAYEIANDYKNGNPLNTEQVSRVRLLSCYDKTHLKGDFVISLIISILERNSSELEFTPWRGGKCIKISEKMLTAIYHNHFTKQMSVTEFCLKNRLTRTKYYRIVNCDVKLNSDKEYLRNFKKTVQMSLN